MKETSFFKKNIIIHTHIEKSAGTSFITGFEELFGREHVLDLRGEIKSAIKLKYLYVISGHIHYSKKLPDIPYETSTRQFLHTWYKKKLYLCTIRDPLARFTSYYNHVLATTGFHPAYEELHNKSLDQAFELYNSNNHINVNNTQCAVISGKRDGTFEDARESVDKNYALIAPNYEVNDALNIIAKIFNNPKSFPQERKINVGKPHNDQLNSKNLRLFNSLNQDDQKLFEYIEKNYSRMKIKFESTVCR